MELQGRVAAITGGGSGIGQAGAVLFAREGARVAICGRTMEKLEETAELIRKEGGQVLPIVADVADPNDMEAFYNQIASRWGRLDVVWAHAGINGVWAPVDEIEPKEWNRTIQINLAGTFYTVRYALPMLKQNGGSIIITSSINGTRIFSNTGASAYSASKAGQVAFMKMIALELAKHRIRVNAICPGAIDTDVEEHTEIRDVEREKEPVEFPAGQIPLTDGKPGRPEQVAELALFLASDRSSHISGSPIWIDGTQSLLQG